MKLLFFMFLFISGLSLTQKRILFSIDSVTFYQTPKIFNYSDPVEDTSVTFYSEIDYYVLYDLDLNNNTISIYYNRQIFKYSITKKQINSDLFLFL